MQILKGFLQDLPCFQGWHERSYQNKALTDAKAWLDDVAAVAKLQWYPFSGTTVYRKGDHNSYFAAVVQGEVCAWDSQVEEAAPTIVSGSSLSSPLAVLGPQDTLECFPGRTRTHSAVVSSPNTGLRACSDITCLTPRKLSCSCAVIIQLCW